MNLIFVSSPQTEFAHERKELCYFILTDPYLKEYFDVFLFENLPANQRNPENNYRNYLENCDIYLGLFGKTYSSQNEDGVSATEREFNYATELGKDRVIYIKQLTQRTKRARKMTDLINQVKQTLTYDTFSSLDELKLKVMQSLLFWQQGQSASGGIGR